MAIALRTDWFSCWVHLTLFVSTLNKLNQEIILLVINKNEFLNLDFKNIAT